MEGKIVHYLRQSYWGKGNPTFYVASEGSRERTDNSCTYVCIPQYPEYGDYKRGYDIITSEPPTIHVLIEGTR